MNQSTQKQKYLILSQDKNGLIICRSIEYYIIGQYSQEIKCAVAIEAIEKLGFVCFKLKAEYFRKKGI